MNIERKEAWEQLGTVDSASVNTGVSDATRERMSQLSELSSNLLEGIQFLKMQDASLSVTGRNLDRMLVLHGKYHLKDASEAGKSMYDQEVEILQRHIGSLQTARYKNLALFSEIDSKPIRLYTLEQDRWTVLDINRPDINALELMGARHGTLSGINDILLTADLIHKGIEYVANSRLINGAQVKRIEGALSDAKRLLIQPVRDPEEGDGKVVALEIAQEALAQGESVLSIAQGLGSGSGIKKISFA